MLGAWLPAHVDSLSGVLDELAKAKRNNSLPAETILATQAVTLDALYHAVLARAQQCGNVYHIFEKYLRLALKAQNQCRSTLIALQEIRCPRPIQYVGQANISAGPQQVNNQTAGEKSVGKIFEADGNE